MLSYTHSYPGASMIFIGQIAMITVYACELRALPNIVSRSGPPFHGCGSAWRCTGPIHSASPRRAACSFFTHISHWDAPSPPLRRGKWAARRPPSFHCAFETICGPHPASQKTYSIVYALPLWHVAFTICPHPLELAIDCCLNSHTRNSITTLCYKNEYA